MKKLISKQKLIGGIVIILSAVILATVITTNIVKNNGQVANEGYSATSANAGSSLISNYILNGITIGGITGKMDVLNTSDATATAEDIAWGKTAYVDGKKITGTYRTLGMLQVGDYVAYIPDTTQTSYSLSSTYSGYNSNQTISKENLSWRVLSINDDGTVDLISSAPTSKAIYFRGALGYNNAVYLLNDICAYLYSNSKLGVTARSLNIEDIEKHMTEAGIEYAHSAYSTAGILWGNTYSYYNYEKFPSLYAEENGSGINTTEVKTDGIGQSDSYYTSPTTEGSQSAGMFTVTQTFYNRNMSSNYYDNNTFYNLIHNAGSTYWLASRYVSANASSSNFGNFGIYVIVNSATNGNCLLSSYRGESTGNALSRPVVSLKSNIRLSSGDGSEGAPYQIAD